MRVRNANLCSRSVGYSPFVFAWLDIEMFLFCISDPRQCSDPVDRWGKSSVASIRGLFSKSVLHFCFLPPLFLKYQDFEPNQKPKRPPSALSMGSLGWSMVRLSIHANPNHLSVRLKMAVKFFYFFFRSNKNCWWY